MEEFRLVLPKDQGVIGYLDADGVVTFAIGADGSPIRGTEMFDWMIRAFQPRVRAILGVWRKGYAGHRSVNIDTVNKLTATGWPIEESIRHTWTFCRAARWGFSRASIVGVPEGVPGAYTKLDVLMEKVEELS